MWSQENRVQDTALDIYVIAERCFYQPGEPKFLWWCDKGLSLWT